MEQEEEQEEEAQDPALIANPFEENMANAGEME